MDKQYLFVYGTLRKDFGLALMKELERKLVFCGSGKIKAALYDLGSYPAAVKTEPGSEVWGDVYEVLETGAFAVLDEYEGDEYCRELADVEMEAGGLTRAWIYWYTGATNTALLIEESDYLNYLKNKKDRFV